MFYYRYQQIKCIFSETQQINYKEVFTSDKIKLILRLNKYSFYLSLIVVISLASVGCFRVSESLILHLIFAIPLFLIFPVLFLIQTWITFKLIALNFNSLIMAKVRLFIAIISILSIFLSGISICWSILSLNNRSVVFDFDFRVNWNNSINGYLAHCFSALGEWLFIFSLSSFIGTFSNEFKKFHIKNGSVKLIINNNETLL
jgi:hypothetical protein